ncbi:hypothetical protein [Nannocystis sp. SCPEA4]|uniref:hypothetical protein n=1 Tax=Nannocystis sp. SCPEA4 TaxID=2996787 RepID=UPI00227063AA|nr:hypothetical protein [Nannocystis sp. SCPEA4]MCY1060198.1 hypothetical protein [Nannocystis sp. SCPEA4]
MSLTHIAALTLLLAAPDSAAPDVCGPLVAGSRDRARARYDAGEYLDAARAFESLWRCGHQARDLLNAVQGYQLAERLAESIALWDDAVAAGLPIDDALRDKGQALVDAARSHTTALRLELAVEGAVVPRVAEVSVCRPGEAGAACGIRRSVALARRGAALQLELDPGPWRLRVQWAGHAGETARDVVVGGEARSERITWRSGQPPRRLAAGLLGAAGVLGAAGIGVSAVGWQYDVTRTAADDTASGIEGLAMRTAGAAVGAASLGLAVSGATLALTTSPRLRRFGVTGLAMGAAFAGAGLGLLIHAADRHRAFDPDLVPDSYCAQSYQCIAGEHLIGGVALGLGGGLLVGGIAGLVVDRPARRAPRHALTPAFGRGSASLHLRLEF